MIKLDLRSIPLSSALCVKIKRAKKDIPFVIEQVAKCQFAISFATPSLGQRRI